MRHQQDPARPDGVQASGVEHHRERAAAGGIDQARTASKILNMVAWLLPILAIGCFVCSAVMVRPRRRARRT